MDWKQAMPTAERFFREAQSILFITGAGISADSGLPTYRGFGGLYDGRLTEDGMTIETALSSSVFRERPEITWKYLAQIEAVARGKQFNSAHAMIARLEQQWPRVWTLTQNIDGFHLHAGSQQVIEIHGTLRRLVCTHCGAVRHVDSYERETLPPHCRECQGMLRPDVVLFEEPLPTRALETLYRECRRGFDLVVSIGTTGQFPYIVEPLWSALRQGIPTIDINPSAESEISQRVDLPIRAGAAEAMEALGRGLGIWPI